MPSRLNKEPPLKKGQSDFDRPIRSDLTRKQVDRGLQEGDGVRPFAPNEKDYDENPPKPRPFK